MKVITKFKNTSAGTQYVKILKPIQNRILDDMTQWYTDWRENYSDPTHQYYTEFFVPNNNLPKRGTGNDRSRAQGFNSVDSYISGIVANHRYHRNPETGKFTTDFTAENIEWISGVSVFMNHIDPTKYTKFEFINEEDYVNPADELFDTK